MQLHVSKWSRFSAALLCRCFGWCHNSWISLKRTRKCSETTCTSKLRRNLVWARHSAKGTRCWNGTRHAGEAFEFAVRDDFFLVNSFSHGAHSTDARRRRLAKKPPAGAYLPADQARSFKSRYMRHLFIALDRPDVRFASKDSLSSGESEFFTAVFGACGYLGLSAMILDLGFSTQAELRNRSTDTTNRETSGIGTLS